MTRLAVKVVPRAARDEIVGWSGDRLRIRVAAAPERGRANAAVERVLADALGLTRRSVRVVSGHTSPRKLIEIDGLDEGALAVRLPDRA